jgi:hypothetical protein
VKYSVEKMEINVPIEDSVFTMPLAKPEAKTAGGAQ